MRKTKIICTLGPVSANEPTIEALCNAGMNVARINMSHETHEIHGKVIQMIKNVRERLGIPLAIMLDTKGPEYRIGLFKDGSIELADGAPFTFTTEDVLGDENRVSVSYKNLPKEMNPGEQILLNNGLLRFEVERVEGNDIHCTTVIGGKLSNRKSMSFPNKVLQQVYLSEQDKKDILFGIENGVDFIACSFVSGPEDLIAVKEFIRENHGEQIDLIAKIENRAGIDNIDTICAQCEGIMIGRGDMGVEIPFETLPAIQKHLITKCRLLGKRVITATEMLESMISCPRPTRAEISDVANAVYDGTSAIMLSGETAAGKYPVEAAATMAKIAEQTEQNIHYAKRFRTAEFKIKNVVDAISHAACGMAIDTDAEAIAVCSLSGRTIRMVSRFRCPADILGLTTNECTYRKLALSWGVTPIMIEPYDSTDVLFYQAKTKAKEVFGLSKGQRLVILGGYPAGTSGNTNTIKAETI